MNEVHDEKIRNIVRKNVAAYASNFEKRHLNQINDPNGTINMKIHNVFIDSLGSEIKYYTALVRSLDSSLGNMLEKMAIDIAKLSFEVDSQVEGELYPEQTSKIAELLEAYKNRNNSLKPCLSHYDDIRIIEPVSKATGDYKTHSSDYYLYDEENDTHHLIELKIGGDLDNKKARSEKEAIFEQFAILSNTLGKNAKIECHFATAYNRFGEQNEWKQMRVLQFFAKEELLIGKDFWNFVCRSENGYGTVLDEYNKSAYLIVKALENIKREYLK